MNKPEFIPLVTENPQGNYQWLHNMTVIKDREVFLRDFNGEGDLSLVDYCKQECKAKCDSEIDAGPEEFGEYMDCNCIVSYFYCMAVGHAELRERLKQYEESGLSPSEVSDFVKAKEVGRLVVLPCKVGDSVWYIEQRKIVRGVVDGYLWFRSCGFALNVVWDEPIMDNFAYLRKEMPCSHIGKTVFLTKEEAEKALAKARGESHE